MTVFLSRLRIPTLLGLSILILGITAGVYLEARDKNLITKASPGVTPQNLIITNIDDSQVTISWQTSVETSAFIIYGQSLNEINPLPLGNKQTVLDDRDANSPRPRTIHYFTLRNLLPKTTYQYKIVSGKYNSDILKFITASPPSLQNGFSPVIGSVLINDLPLDNGIAYLTISGAVIQSAVIKDLGNFVLSLSTIRKSDLSDTFALEEGIIGKITVISDKGEANALFKLEASAKPLPPIKLGQNLDLTTLDLKAKVATENSGLNETKYDLNGDGLINAADYAIVLQNLNEQVLPSGKQNSKKGQGPASYKTSDLNKDGTVDQKDLELLSKQLARE